MTATALKKVLGTYDQLLHQAPMLAHITGEAEYESALEFIEFLMEVIGDHPDDPRWGLVEIAAKAIEHYEMKMHPKFEALLEKQTDSASVLRVLMDQYQLEIPDLPEIGNADEVTEIVNGHQELNLTQIRALSQRFQLDPGLFL